MTNPTPASKMLEEGIADIVNQNQPTPRVIPMPETRPIAGIDYVTHGKGVPEIGMVTAEAVLRDYEETAKTFTELGAQIKDAANRCENYLEELKDISTYMNKVAQESRERAANIFKAIEESAKITAQVRKQAEELYQQVLSTPIMKNY